MHLLINYRDFFQIVELIIGQGKNQVLVNVPNARLCEVSEFLAACCSERWPSGREGVIQLEDEDPKIVSLFRGLGIRWKNREFRGLHYSR